MARRGHEVGIRRDAWRRATTWIGSRMGRLEEGTTGSVRIRRIGRGIMLGRAQHRGFLGTRGSGGPPGRKPRAQPQQFDGSGALSGVPEAFSPHSGAERMVRKGERDVSRGQSVWVSAEDPGGGGRLMARMDKSSCWRHWSGATNLRTRYPSTGRSSKLSTKALRSPWGNLGTL